MAVISTYNIINKSKMKKYTVLLAFAAFHLGFSQEMQLTSKDSIVQSSWMIGLGMNVVADPGTMFDGLLEVEDNWNVVPYPSRISIGRYFKNGLGVEAIGTYNQYKQGKNVDGTINPETKDYMGLDTRLSYDLNKLVGQTGWFDPYVGVGLGYTDANDVGRGTYNAVIGFRTWFTDRIGLDFSSSGKWGMGSTATNHLQHAAGLVYQFDIEKGLSKKGQEKLALMEELAKERQRVADSTAAADRAAMELAEQMAREKEAARLAAEERARQEAENQRRTQIENDIKALGNIYFALNSSYLNNESKATLKKLGAFMEATPSISLEVSAHTDSRGSDKYNLWLSERRVERTIGYLLQQGVTSDRLTPEARGEQDLLNECDDHTKCSEAKHQLNRRSEFKVIKF
jgi:outer membrane protein OmpA-like peptidoglycan-associated protein